MYDKVIPPNHQGCIQLKIPTPIVSNSENILFEPDLTQREKFESCVIAKSLHSSQSGAQIFCNILNAGDKEIIIKKGQLLGNVSEAEVLANEEFSQKVKAYRPLNISVLEMSRILRNNMTKRSFRRTKFDPGINQKVKQSQPNKHQ